MPSRQIPGKTVTQKLLNVPLDLPLRLLLARARQRLLLLRGPRLAQAQRLHVSAE